MAGITSIKRDWADGVNIVRIVASGDTLATVSTANYILNQAANILALNSGPFDWQPSDMVLVYASDGWTLASISSDFKSLNALVFSNTVVNPPVVIGNFAVFASTGGNIQDLGYLPSDDTKTRVVMADGATTIGHIATYVDTTGTVGEDAATAINAGNIQAGLITGTAGTVSSYAASASKGALILKAVANTGNTNTTISNVAMGQASVVSIPDPATATANFVVAPAALISGNVLQASGTAGLVVDSGASGLGLLKVASVAISAAEFNGMYAAPKLLIAAPGANNLIVVDRLVLVMTFVSAAYAAGGVVAAQYDSTVNGAGAHATNSEAAADFFAAASATFQFEGVSGNTVGVVPFSTSVNKGLYLSNLTGAFTTGDSTWVAKVYYRIVAVV